MKKARVFFVAAAMLLVTAGVFAGKSKFQTTALYAYNGSTWYELASSITLAGDWSTVGTVQAKVTDNQGNTFPVYYQENTSDKIFVTATF